jgi:hypothetical protein
METRSNNFTEGRINLQARAQYEWYLSDNTNEQIVVVNQRVSRHAPAIGNVRVILVSMFPWQRLRLFT